MENTTKSIVLKKLLEAGENYISGGELSRSLNISRNAVWKAVKALEAEGFVIESATAKGYRLGNGDILLPELISGRNAVILSETDSTNNYAKKLAAKGEAAGTVVLAETQIGGKGRLGRKFESPKGSGLYMSMILRPRFDISLSPLITSSAAVAAAEAVEELCGCRVDIKWVNDLYVNGKKICGILTEASLSMEMNSLEYAVVGIGINTASHDFGELASRVTDLESETGVRVNRCELCGRIANRLEYWLDNMESRLHLGEYRRREMLTGHMITASFGGKTITGKAVGIDENANLTVETENNGTLTLTSGEASLIRKI
ncbi:MAG: biotin--[acetyl-CoA-carboxylase] ligase [Alistipes sp.]|nr:biotin--[acetyl-CoA-carboxylase] ligase [Alistipes sp.]